MTKKCSHQESYYISVQGSDPGAELCDFPNHLISFKQMPEPTTTATLSTQLMADANTTPVKTLEEFLAAAAATPMPDNPPEGTLQARNTEINI
ncbi:hypothetical protein BGZ49_000239 [Haplosporangium sp. Z 27]|nr:hypothetical protein BGZ49_000239 [Haplosporangium sp. Z 27]